MNHRRINTTNDGDGVILKAESGDSGEIDRRRFVKTAGGILIAAGGVVWDAAGQTATTQQNLDPQGPLLAR